MAIIREIRTCVTGQPEECSSPGKYPKPSNQVKFRQVSLCNPFMTLSSCYQGVRQRQALYGSTKGAYFQIRTDKEKNVAATDKEQFSQQGRWGRRHFMDFMHSVRVGLI